MKPYYKGSRVTIYHADCRSVLAALPDCSVDSVVTDPPAGIGFMGKEWDDFRRARNEADANRENVFGRTSKTGPEYGRCDRANFVEFLTGVMKECLRVLKPGGHAVVWSIPRTSHWTAWALEDAGFDVRDCVLHLFGSGFPKSLDVSKAIDKAAGAEREDLGPNPNRVGRSQDIRGGSLIGDKTADIESICRTTAPATEAAKQWSGWGTALKPAAEFWWLCRKPLEGTVAANVQTWGVGGLNIDGCRIPTDGEMIHVPQSDPANRAGTVGCDMGITRAGAERFQQSQRESVEKANSLGRWPANVTHDGSEEVLSEFPEAPGQLADLSYTAPSAPFKNAYGKMNREGEATADKRYTDNGGTDFAPLPGQRRFDSGSAARFFYCAKASTAERGRSNDHPTVKPIDLMRWLCRLVTPPDGTVLDCFMGSGSTLVAAREEGFHAIGIEREENYAQIAMWRLAQEVLF